MPTKLFVHGRAVGVSGTVVARVTDQPLPGENRGDVALLDPAEPFRQDPAGYAAVLATAVLDQPALDAWTAAKVPVVHSLPYLDHLHAGDVVAIQPTGFVRTLFRRASPHNALFATDRCNSFCVMCSQPPKPIDDSDRIHEHLRLIWLIDRETRELGITGGEPTLLKRDLVKVIAACKEHLPKTGIHVLSNGRLFFYESFARELAAVEHPALTIGVPIYSDLDWEHDFIVQARGAFEQTMLGLHSLARYGVDVEIRVVIHQYSYRRLPALAEFIYRNLPFAAHVALMGLEIMGFTVPNLQSLWIDPIEYCTELEEATLFLASRGMRVSVYNHQLCVVPRSLWPFCRKSISDWKNDYLPQCERCLVKGECGGFFTSSIARARSAHIAPVTE